MIESLELVGFGPFAGPMAWPEHARLNVLVGENDTGKTQLLKLLYAVVRAAEEYWKKQRGPEPESYEALLTRKLLWTFTPGWEEFSLGRLVHKGSDRARYLVTWSGGRVEAQWGGRAQKHLASLAYSGLDALHDRTATFLPAKEILSLFGVIRETRETSELAGFDDTYYDLFRDFQKAVPPGRLQDPVYDALKLLGQATGGGQVELDQHGRVWWERSGTRLPISQAAEGNRKSGILSRLMRNRRINPARGGFLFVDEPEAHLHPRAEVLLADLLEGMARAGIQVYVATHSYFVLKRLEQLARRHGADHKLIEPRRGPAGALTARSHLLREEVPANNPIVVQALDLFATDMELDFQDANRAPSGRW